MPVAARVVDATVLRLVVIALVAVVVVGYGMAAMSTLGFILPQAAWPALVIASTVGSAALMVIGLSPALTLGIAIDVVLLVVATTALWAPGRLVSGI